MCGITGIAGFDERYLPDYPILKTMCDTIAHRGPDDEGIDIQYNVGIGMRRLSIIDLSGGRQPIFNEDRSIRVVFNGEIYNFIELRRDLISRGHHFSTNTDTEVIVHAYEEYGKDFPKYFNGMFAFALHDMKNHKLFLVRDHLGIKPLFYSFDHRYIVWGSEIKTLLASGFIEKKLDIDALGEFLAWEYIPGSKTLFQNICKLDPGAMIEVDLDRPSCNPSYYWDIPQSTGHTEYTDEDWADIVDKKTKECVQRQMVSDVPLGAFLSGGVDSSLVVNAMGAAKTFSIGFDDPSYNELNWARKVANHLGVNHQDEIIKPDVLGLFSKLMYFMDDPIGDFSIFPTFLVSQHARNHVTVSLSGDGGDELFGGYDTYLANNKASQYTLIPNFIRENFIEGVIKHLRPSEKKKGLINKALRFIEGMEHPEELAHARWRIFCGELQRKKLFSPEAYGALETPATNHILELFRRSGQRDQLNRSLYVDTKSYLCDNCLVKVDRMSMAVSLEVRVPLLDKELVELAFSIPEHLKVARGKTKILLKAVASRYAPSDCVYRQKEGFSIPIKQWLSTTLRPVMEDLLSREKIDKDGLFDAAFVEKMKQEHLSGTANHSHVLWSLIVFQAWRKQWLEGS